MHQLGVVKLSTATFSQNGMRKPPIRVLAEDCQNIVFMEVTKK
jgi:hypothetical protein